MRFIYQRPAEYFKSSSKTVTKNAKMKLICKPAYFLAKIMYKLKLWARPTGPCRRHPLSNNAPNYPQLVDGENMPTCQVMDEPYACRRLQLGQASTLECSPLLFMRGRNSDKSDHRPEYYSSVGDEYLNRLKTM